MPVVKNNNLFSYIKGTGKSDKAEYRLGRVSIPAAVITRLEAEVAGKPENKQNHIIYAALEKKYSDFLDAVEAQEMEYSEALAAMVSIKPKKSVATGQRASAATKNAEAFVKGIAKRFKGTPEEMVMQFQVAVASEGFKAEAIDILSSYLKQYGKGPTGFIKTSGRKGNLAAIKALAKARASKKLK